MVNRAVAADACEPVMLRRVGNVPAAADRQNLALADRMLPIQLRVTGE